MSGDEWVPAKPIPGTIVVIVGDLLALWTSNRYKATVMIYLVVYLLLDLIYYDYNFGRFIAF